MMEITALRSLDL